MKKRLIWAVSASVLLFFCCIFIPHMLAVNDNATVVNNISPFALEKNMSKTLNSFSETSEGWDCIDKGVDVTLSETISSAPYYPLTKDGCLTVRNKNALSGKWSYSSKTYTTPLDLSSYNSLFISANCLPVEDSTYDIIVHLYSNNNVFTAEQSISPSSWNGVFVDISKWNERSSITQIRIGVKYTSSTVGDAFFEYYIDSIMLSENENVVKSVLFLSENYTAIGCTVGYADEKMILNVNSITAHIEATNLSYDNFGDANTLKVTFDTKGKCSGVRLFVRINSTDYKEESYASINNTAEGIKTCYLPITSQDIDGIMLVFENLETDQISIHGITPYSMNVANDSSSLGQIDTCAINISSNEILIMGKINNTYIDTYSGKELLLFEQNLYDDSTEETLSQINSTLKSTVSSGDFIFRIKCNKKEELKAYLYKKYTVAIKTEEKYMVLDSPKCITNPEILSEQTNILSKKTSGKGQYGSSLSFMQENMIPETCLTVDIGKFFSPSANSGTKFECGGSVFYYDPQYIEQLDSVLLPYAQKGIKVSLIITLTDTGNDSLNKILVHPDSQNDAEHLAYNPKSRTSLLYLRAFCEFFAQRYCIENPCVTRIVFGYAVGNSYNNYNMGKKTLTEFSNDYVTAFLTVNSAVRSISGNTEIYTHIDNNWDMNLPFDFYYRFDNSAFLQALNACISEYGNINWGIMLEPYPEKQKNYLAFKDTSLTKEIDSDLITFSNLEILNMFLSRSELLFNNAPRNFAIIEKTNFSDLDEITLAADYAYNYYKAMNLSASAYITDRNCNYKNIIKHIDSSLSLDTTRFALELIGEKTWEEAISNFSTEKIIKNTYAYSEFTPYLSDKKGSIDISYFSYDTDRWNGYGISEELTAEKEMSDRSDLLSVKLGQIPAGELRGIVKKFDSPFDMSLIPLLNFDVNIASLPPDTDTARLTVIITSENNVTEFSGIIQKAVWTEIYCDLSSFSGIEKVDSISILLSSKSGEAFDDPQLFISTIRGVSLEHSEEYLRSQFFVENEETKFAKFIKQYSIPALVTIICISTFILGFRFHKSKK